MEPQGREGGRGESGPVLVFRVLRAGMGVGATRGKQTPENTKH